MVATARIAAAAHIDASYPPGGATIPLIWYMVPCSHDSAPPPETASRHQHADWHEQITEDIRTIERVQHYVRRCEQKGGSESVGDATDVGSVGRCIRPIFHGSIIA